MRTPSTRARHAPGKPTVPLLDLLDAANGLPDAWKSRVLAQAGDCNVKILRMDGQPSPAETHDYNEALIVISGALRL